ncbi:unnamed protein product [Arabidopsis lyrata]|uniref:Predicted protein n=1 Tax=Arabidopsis lyrata subsp. lyrata TaxID=81972 RepID=D7LMX9_ARALL|nr:predicted protein [Arabidopsis lyrata subsp. lyrata]CAH8267617.1 unnamed protein product [Arabidopsis lyrata]
MTLHKCMVLNVEQLRAQPIPHSSRGPDEFLWRCGDDDFRPEFSTTHTWNQIRTHHPVISWSSIIWFGQSIPRCGFIAWLAMRTGNLLRQPQDPDWSATVMVLISGSGSYLDDILLKLCFQITIYTIWHERNNRIHNGYHSTMTQVLRRIEKTVRNRITSLDYTKKPRLRRLMQRWFEAGPMLLRKN